MNKSNIQKDRGFSFVEIILAIVVLGVISFMVYYVMDKQNADDEPATSTGTSETIESAEDLERTEANLSEEELEELDTTELEALEAELY